MALNLSTLTGATSGEVLAEALTTADFLEPVPVLRNLARGSQKGGDAKQDVALNQPRSLPLIKNPAGNLGGYLYIPNVSGNYATGPSVTIGANQTWQGELDMVVTQFGNYIVPMGGGFWSSGFGLIFENTSGGVLVLSKAGPGLGPQPSGVTLGTPFNVKYGYDGTDVYVDIDGVRKFSTTAPSQAAILTQTIQLNQQNNLPALGNYAIQKAKLTVNSSVVFDCDFNGSTSIRHGDTKFNCVGGPVTINQAGNDPATVIKKPVLRFDGVNDGLQGLFNQTITEGYMFAAFSVLGNGGETSARVFSINSTSEADYATTGSIVSGMRGVNLSSYDPSSGWVTLHSGLTDDANGDILHEIKFIAGSQQSRVNNADESNSTISLASLSSEEFNIGDAGAFTDTSSNAALDLEYLALFPSSITDAQADAVRSFINNRNNVFDLKDGFGYYFFDAQKAPVGNITDVNTWSGRIVGSDNGDSASIVATQATANHQPVGDGFKVTFADNTDHLDIPSTSQAGWQVVGTSLGTFAYRVNNTAVTELNLLGNAGTQRLVGDSYGIILLPESATNADIEQARKLLIDRGAADSVVSIGYGSAWNNRTDIVEFRHSSFEDAANLIKAFKGQTALNLFSAIQAPICTNFSQAWQNCSSLQSFPAGAKLGTAANNVDFTSAWQDSGLTSFPALDLSSGTTFFRAWQSSDLISFPENIDLSSGIDFNDAWRNINTLLSFPTGLNLSSGQTFDDAWRSATSLTSFPLINIPSGKRFRRSWYNCSSMTDWPSGFFDSWSPSYIFSGVFQETWDDCTSLTADSVGNILQSIDASNQHGTDDGTSTGNPLGDSGIDIDYDGTTLSAATNAAIDSLSGKGWEVFINGVLVIPNILDLAPAAAYSLRSFDADADPNVVNVRRSSDGATSDFKASEVSDGTLTSWVGAGNDGHVTTWYDQGGTNHATQATASSQPKIVDGGTLVTEGGLAALDFPTELSNLSLAHSDIYGQATLDSYYVTSITDIEYIYPSCLTSPSHYGMVAVLGSGSTNKSNFYGSPFFYANGSRITGTRGDIHTATSGGQKLVTHVNADTTGSEWGTGNMNFGNYANDIEYSYTGKLQEMIFFNTDQSANRTGIENNINDHFDIYS
ncbi:hypothetical protein OAF89_02185 [bacterium]|nr:hypothetical protein [bacterium]